MKEHKFYYFDLKENISFNLKFVICFSLNYIFSTDDLQGNQCARTNDNQLINQ